MKMLSLIAAIFVVSAACAQDTANDALGDNGDRAATAAEKIVGIDNPPTGEERVRDAARNAGSKAAGGADDWHDNYKAGAKDISKAERANKEVKSSSNVPPKP